MLHLLPVRQLLTGLIGVVAAIFVAAPFLGADESSIAHISSFVTRVVPMIATCVFVGSLMGWRWIQIIQDQIFPYLGGTSSGNL